MNSSRWTAIALSALVFCSPAAEAATRPQSDDQLTGEADKIVLGSLLSKQSYWSADSLIYTHFVIAADITVKGEEHATVVVQVPGGVVGDTGMDVSDAPELKDGERVLLFLARSRKDKDRYEVVGRDAGKYRAASERAAAALESAFQSLETAAGQKLQYKRGLAHAFLTQSRDALTTTTTTTATSACYIAAGVKWPSAAVTFKPGASVPTTWTPSINAAAATWTGAGAAFSLTNNFNSTNELSYLDLVAKYGSSYANTYAVATTWWNTTTNQISKATIEINTKFRLCVRIRQKQLFTLLS